LDVERFIKKHKITRDDWRRVKITRKMIEDAKQLDIKLSPASGKTHTLHSRSALWISSIYFINMIRYTEDCPRDPVIRVKGSLTLPGKGPKLNFHNVLRR